MSVTTLSTTPQRIDDVSAVTECTAAGTEPLAVDEATRRAALLKALADPVRLQLLSIITGSPGQEACVCDMTELVDVAQPTVSHHLKVLVDAGILTRHRRGNWAWFRLDAERVAEVRGFLA
ncbi:ArsR/SmtB family transcription factor [Humibacillus xanthopallidus]|uniref:ArsR family transcriptional regulator n=1 Tax=Humibacillus xanthopallidus TaxID=412689 RepID=A0A543I3M3_9MICO|nr:metalloregulator ArsR/SmtB family transcription factor [Humibacillus xanthopallidus]TQM65193.1 ArsR family transcriptional regulator [Humibacillus xanthopallidus]